MDMDTLLAVERRVQGVTLRKLMINHVQAEIRIFAPRQFETGMLLGSTMGRSCTIIQIGVNTRRGRVKRCSCG